MEVFSCKNATNNVSVRSSIFELFDLNDGHLENRTGEIIITRSIKNGCFAGKKCYLLTKQNQFLTNQIHSSSFEIKPFTSIIQNFSTLSCIFEDIIHFLNIHCKSRKKKKIFKTNVPKTPERRPIGFA